MPSALRCGPYVCGSWLEDKSWYLSLNCYLTYSPASWSETKIRLVCWDPCPVSHVGVFSSLRCSPVAKYWTNYLRTPAVFPGTGVNSSMIPWLHHCPLSPTIRISDSKTVSWHSSKFPSWALLKLQASKQTHCLSLFTFKPTLLNCTEYLPRIWGKTKQETCRSYCLLTTLLYGLVTISSTLRTGPDWPVFLLPLLQCVYTFILCLLTAALFACWFYL